MSYSVIDGLVITKNVQPFYIKLLYSLLIVLCKVVKSHCLVRSPLVRNKMYDKYVIQQYLQHDKLYDLRTVCQPCRLSLLIFNLVFFRLVQYTIIIFNQGDSFGSKFTKRCKKFLEVNPLAPHHSLIKPSCSGTELNRCAAPEIR